MPEDQWFKSKLKKSAAGRSFERDTDREKRHDDKIDAWIAKREAARKKKRKRRK
jgi:hypothetical protein